MATKSEVFYDSKCVTHPPPPYYQNIYTPASSSTARDSIRIEYAGKLISPLFSFLRNKQKRKTVLSHIRDIISDSNFASSSIVPTVNACAAAISPTEFSNLLQKPNIEGHTAMYWAIVNHQPEAFSAFAAFIPKFSSVCSSDLRLACMFTSNHALFTQLNLGRVINRKDNALRNFLGCPPDEVQVHDAGDGLHKIKFNICFCIRMFQKRLLMRQQLGIEFVAAGRIWLFQIFSMALDGLWRIFLSLSKESLPACPEAVLVIEAHSGKHDCATPPQDLRLLPVTNSQSMFLQVASQESVALSDATLFTWRLKDWFLNENTMYVDRNGALHAKLEVTLI
ncbi:hypothetical protein DFJ58DRAFT_744987 [Suillus subalutaceus]|uniref:uncharacterized protein n=1 Tax=Suillus subalutaceus TaxID=48586 RepID=UPI001B87D74A|nr:uncharacterized protein DFJ58DRAFT_744987 [Suillus subalutaceus]KAG1857684.1 hypothetical protein DFJ58DRAFT_744987 [Suillus subalutaceus]